MAVIYNCIYCGNKIESDFVYDGPITGVLKYVDDKTKELSEKCGCRNAHEVMEAVEVVQKM